MQKLYKDVRPLDSSIIESLELSEDILMENAAMALEKELIKKAPLKKGNHLIIVCGGGNNGADGYTLARRLSKSTLYTPIIWIAKEAKSSMCILQQKRAQKAKITFFNNPKDLPHNDFCIVDCFFGSGLKGTIDPLSKSIIETMNIIGETSPLKVACDMPSGLSETVTNNDSIFKADITVTMGALKTALYTDYAKDFCGKIICASLGINKKLYENTELKEEALLLEKSDLVLPIRKKNNSHKGSYGHAVVFKGEKQGAAIIAASAAYAFGAGLVSLIHKKTITPQSSLLCPIELMETTEIPKNTTAVCIGVGLGRNDTKREKKIAHWLCDTPECPCVLDADMCWSKELPTILFERSKKNALTVITPHPKEFSSILNLCSIQKKDEDTTLDTAQKFCEKYPGITLLLKGANPIIACKNNNDNESDVSIYINPLGKPCLAKGGSGDVLAGLITALLAQKDFGSAKKNKALFCAIQGSLAHSLSSTKIKTSFGMTPSMLIEEVKML